MTYRIVVGRTFLWIALACVGAESFAQSRKVSPPSRMGPSAAVRRARISPDRRAVVYEIATTPWAMVGLELLVATDQGVRSLVEGRIDDFEISLDSRYLVFKEQGLATLSCVPLDGSSGPYPLTPPALVVDSSLPFQFSALGRVVFQGSAGSDVRALYSVALTGDEPPVRLDLAGGRTGSFEVSPDGAWVGYLADPESDGSEVFVVPVTGSIPARNVSGPLARDAYVVHRFTPTSERLVYRVSAPPTNQGVLYSASVLVPEPPRRLSANSTVSANTVQTDFALSPDGQFAFYRHNALQAGIPELFRVPVGGGTTTRLSAPMVAGGGVRAFTVVSDGSVVYRADQEVNNKSELYHVAGGLPPRKVNANLAPAQDVTAFQVASDGVRVLFVVEPPGTVYLGALSGPPGPVALPDGPSGPIRSPFHLSRNGQGLAFEDQDTLYSLRLDGVSAPVKLTPAGPEFRVEEFQLELERGRALVRAWTGSAFELFAVPLVGGATLPYNAPLPRNTPLEHVGTSALSPDGRWAVFGFGEPADMFLYAADLERQAQALRLSAETISNTHSYGWFEVTPDSTRVLYLSAVRELFVVPIDGSAPPLLLDAASSPGDIQLAPDATRVLYSDAQGRLHSAALDGSTPPVLLGGFPVTGNVTLQGYRFSADGSRVVYHFSVAGTSGTQLLAAPIDGSAAPVVLDPSHAAQRLSGVSADGFAVFQTAAGNVSTLWSVPLDGSAAPAALATASLFETREDDPVVVGGERVFFPAVPGELFTVPADGHAAQQLVAPDLLLASHDYTDQGPSASPRRLYFFARPRTGAVHDLYQVPLDLSAAPVRLSRNTDYGYFHRVRESSDGERVGYLLRPNFAPYSPDLALHSVAADGSDEPLRLTGPLVATDYEEEAITTDFALTRDGRTFAFRLRFDHYADEFSSADLFAVPGDASRPPRQVSAAPRDQRNVQSFQLDPDGRFVLYACDEETPDHFELFVAPIRETAGRLRKR